jgi:hypothetical protein
MENMMEQGSESKNLYLDNAGINHLKETRAWTNFLSILGFVFLGLMLVIALIGLTVAGKAYQAPYSGLAVIFLLLFTALYFFPVYYLLMFSRHSKQAVNNGDNVSFVEAMRYLKLHYRFIGILTIVVIGLYIIIILIALSTAGTIFNLFNT